MRMYFSMAQCGFYDATEPFTVLPSDAQELSDQAYAELKAGQSAGRLIDWSGGLPVLVNMPAPTVEQIQTTRRAVYRLESDPLKIEAEYDAEIDGTEPDYTAWLTKVAEIKGRYPLPE